jgi:uncharacterized protein
MMNRRASTRLPVALLVVATACFETATVRLKADTTRDASETTSGVEVTSGVETLQPPPPALTAPVNDLANVIDPDSERELERRIRALQAASGDVVVVATVATFQPYGDIDTYAVKMFENGGRGIGEKGKDNGLLIVVAVQDRKIKIEVGYALEQFITDGFAGETIREAITPEFRSGDYGAGLVAGTTRIINRIAEGRGVTLQNVPREAARPRSTGTGFPWWIIVLWIAILILSNRRRRRRGRFWGVGPWSGWNSGIGPFGGGGGGFGGGFGGFGGGFGGFGGGFGGFGGGGGGGFGGFGGGRSGGGGASGGW